MGLFREFCSGDPVLSNCHNFLECLNDFFLVAEEKGAVTAKKIYDDFLSPEVKCVCVCVCVMFGVGLLIV